MLHVHSNRIPCQYLPCACVCVCVCVCIYFHAWLFLLPLSSLIRPGLYGIALVRSTSSQHHFLFLLVVIVLKGKGRQTGWGKRDGGQQWGWGFRFVSLSASPARPPLPPPTWQTWPLDPCRRPTGWLFPASLTDRIFVPCLKHSVS